MANEDLFLSLSCYSSKKIKIILKNNNRKVHDGKFVSVGSMKQEVVKWNRRRVSPGRAHPSHGTSSGRSCNDQ